MDFIKALAAKHGQITVERDVSGKKLTTFGSGGSVGVVIYPQTVEAAAETVSALIGHGCGYAVIGRGSNVLIADEGLKTPLVSLKYLADIAFCADGTLYAGAGATLPRLSQIAATAGLSGLEFACGIPASLGGAVKMNAGAYGAETADKLLFADILSGDTVNRVPIGELGLGYRTSGFSGLVLGAAFRLEEDGKDEIDGRLREMKHKRVCAQPFAPSAGSTFKRANGISAGYYVDAAGLKGVRVGGAEISRVHANFIINRGGATTKDYLALAALAEEKVYEIYGVTLKKEVKYFGDEVLR